MKAAIVLFLTAAAAAAQIRVIPQPSKEPLVTFRIVFTAGSAADPAGKPGLAALTARMVSDGGTKELTYRQILDARFPMAAEFTSQVDKEMTTFAGVTHVDNLAEYYKLLRAQLLEPGWREEDFRRVKDRAIHEITSGLRENDEELGKEVLFHDIFRGTTYGPYNLGTVTSLNAITLDDVKSFYRGQYTQSNLILGIAGNFSQGFLDGMKKDFKHLPPATGFRQRFKMPALIEGPRAIIVEKDTRSVAISIGFPIAVVRNAADYAALLLASSYLGQHRMSGGVLYDEMREKRGLNYGDYAYIEYFPQGMYLMEPNPGLARHLQVFQIWIRPVEPPTAKFALRMALYEFDKLVKEGIPEEGFERTREFLTKYVNVLTRTDRARLGYRIDSLWYAIPDYPEYIRAMMAKLTREEVNAAIKRHLARRNRIVIVAVSKNAEELKKELASDAPSPMVYNSPKPEAIAEVDKVVEKWPLDLREDDIQIVQAANVFQ